MGWDVRYTEVKSRTDPVTFLSSAVLSQDGHGSRSTSWAVPQTLVPGRDQWTLGAFSVISILCIREAFREHLPYGLAAQKTLKGFVKFVFKCVLKGLALTRRGPRQTSPSTRCRL